MSVEYTTKHRDKVSGEFYQTLNETYQYFRNKKNVSILGEGIKEVLSDATIFNSYVDKLCEGLNPSEAEDTRLLMENARTNILLESSTSGIAPVAALTFPSLRVMWARTALIRAIPTEVVKSNAFAVSFNRPFIVTEDGEKLYLPEALDKDTELGDMKALDKEWKTLPIKALDLLGEVGCSKATGDSIDRKFRIASYKIGDEEVNVPTNIGVLDINDRLYLECKNADGTVTDILFGNVDLWNGVMNLVSMNGNVTEVKIIGYVASDAHNHATNISFEMKRRDIEIGTGEHFEASLPIEFLQDAMATYSIDGTAEVTDIMTNIIAQKLDMDLIKFVKHVYEGTNAKYFGKFDCRPSASFAISPKEWREELKTQIDLLASTMMKETHIYQGYFVIMGSPIDMNLLPNTNWTFNHSVDMQNGVEVTYNLGAMNGANRYMCVSSDLFANGDLYILFVPTLPNYKSIQYYPYCFSISDKYLNTQKQNVPSLMMFKRQTIEEFSPWVMRLSILNNDIEMLNNLPR